MAKAWGLHSVNLWHSMCIHGILNNTLNFTRYWKIPPKIISETPSKYIVDVSLCKENKNNNLRGKYVKNIDYPLLFYRGSNPLPLRFHMDILNDAKIFCEVIE